LILLIYRVLTVTLQSKVKLELGGKEMEM